MQRLAFAGLVRIDRPGGDIVRLSQGIDLRWGSDIYLARHPAFGGIASVETMAEGIGNVVPAAQLVLAVPGTVSAAALVQAGSQKSRVRLWLAKYNPDTSTVIDAGNPLFNGFLDQSRLVRGKASVALELAVVSYLEHLFELNLGNSLNPTFHKMIWPGETGEDQATGLVMQDAWGVESPMASVSYSGGMAQSGIGAAAKRNAWGDYG